MTFALVALCGALTALLFWQTKRAAANTDALIAELERNAERRITIAAGKVARADLERALNLAISERDMVQNAHAELRKEHQALLAKSLKDASPEDVASTLAGSLEQLLSLSNPEEAKALPGLPSSEDDHD